MKRSHGLVHCLGLLSLLLLSLPAGAQTNSATQEQLAHLDSKLTRQLDELLWFQRLADVAVVDKVRFTGPPPRSAPAGSNEVIVSAFTFLPRASVNARQLPLLVLAHGEIHGNVATDEEIHVVRELVQQGYALIAPDYRGSSGYGPEFWEQIDYGGREIDDIQAARQFMLDTYPQLDRNRVGILGWSHGGAIALLTVFAHPDDYQACYAGVPVSDLEERIRIRGKGYEQLFAAPYHLGKTAAEDPEEYRRRSPAWNAHRLRTPLLVQANTNDADVTFEEIQKLLHALQAAEKDFAYHVYTNAPGGHHFNRLDTPAAHASRVEIWRFLAAHLHPPTRPSPKPENRKPISSPKQ